MAISPDCPRTPEGLVRGGHTRAPEHSAFGSIENKPAASGRGDAKWTGLGNDSPEAQAAHAKRVADKLVANRPKAAGGTDVLVPAAKRTGQAASNAVGRGRSK